MTKGPLHQEQKSSRGDTIVGQILELRVICLGRKFPFGRKDYDKHRHFPKMTNASKEGKLSNLTLLMLF